MVERPLWEAQRHHRWYDRENHVRWGSRPWTGHPLVRLRSVYEDTSVVSSADAPLSDIEDSEDVFYGESGNRFSAAKMEEIHKWRDLDAYEEVPDTGQPRISCRWVCTEKMKGGQLTLKARLCVRGCEELNDQAKTDSPTCQKESLRVLLCILAAKRWTLNSMDIKSAYRESL